MNSKSSDDANSSRVIYARLLTYVKPYWTAFIFSIAGMGVVAGTEVGFTALIKPMLDGTFVARDPFFIKVIPLAIIGVFALRGIGSYASSYCMSWLGRHVIKDLRREMFDHLLALPNNFFDRNASSLLISKLIYDVEQVADASSKAITVVIQDTLTLIGLLGWMFYLNWKLSLVFLTVGPVMAALVVFINKRVRRYSQRLQNSVGNITQISQESIEAQRVVKIFGGQQHQRGNYETANEYNRQQFMKIVVTNAASVPIVQLMAASLLAVIIYLASRPEMQAEISVGTFMSFISAMLLLFPPLKRLTMVNVNLQRGLAAAQSIFLLLDQNVETDQGTKTLSRAQGAVEYQHVRFQYDSAKGDVLRDINFSCKPGEMVAFVGRSGGGKTSVMALLPRFYNVQSGKILLDGVDIRDIKLSDLRRQIALVSQDITLFNDTIAHNIAYGKLESADEATIKAAAEAAFVMDFVNDLPDGLNTIVGEHGVMLSGGQRQRLAIARAILKDAPILILDEATSALDSESERHIQQALDRLMQNRTTFVIAHRLSTIEKADKIVVMHQGEIVETGSHQELMAKNGHYAVLRKIQFGDA